MATDDMAGLLNKHSRELAPGTPPLGATDISRYLAVLDRWEQRGGEIVKTFKFKNYYETIGFVNAIAFIANAENHHPDLEVGYNKCIVRFSTHSVGGLSENDFICAARIERLMHG